MPTLKSSVLLIGVSGDELTISADTVRTAPEAIKIIDQHNYNVIVVAPALLGKDFISSFQRLRERNPAVQVVLYAPNGQDPHQLAKMIESLEALRISDGSQLQADILLTLERAQEKSQQSHLEKLVQEQKGKLKALYQDLEERVDKRQKFLLDAKKKTFLAHSRWESLRQVMVAAHQSLSISEMEANLTRTLTLNFDVQTLRVVFHPHDEVFLSQFRSSKDLNILPIPIYHGTEKKGSIFFFRSTARPFNREENDFLQRIGEGVALAVDRLQKLEQTAQLRDQWQATFNAVSDPIALINQNYEIIQTNSSLEGRSSLKGKLLGRKCFEVLFQRDSACPSCRRGESFRIDGSRQKTATYEVFSQNLQIEGLEGSVYFNQYHDVTEQVRMERKILESARLAEIGTIGSSIAHELNNPLGGILSFVQLMKMDLKPADKIYDDITEMEQGVRRCQEIIQNLLAFVRDPQADEEISLDLRDVMQRAIKLIELQTKSRGVEVKVTSAETPLIFVGHINLLTQAIRNVLQVSIDALIEAGQQIKGFQAALEVRLSSHTQEYQILILDNGHKRDSAASLGLSVARQIIYDYGGQLELGTAAKPLRSVKISLPRRKN